MFSEEIQRLMTLLDESHASMHSTISGNNPEVKVYRDPDWDIQDIIIHIATWDMEVTRSIRAFIKGEEYAIANHVERDYNAEDIKKNRALTLQKILLRYEQARSDFKKAVGDVPADKISADLLYPWGDERGSVSKLVEIMDEHDRDHQTEIKAAIDASTGG